MNNKKSFLSVNISIFVATLLSSLSAWSQELEEILITARRGAAPAAESANAVSLVSEQRIQELQATVVPEMLQGAPGVFIQQTTPGQGTAIVRGLKGSEILHLVDGMRLNNALFRNAPNQYLALVDPWIVSRAEVVRGPLSSLYGSDAMGGVVQLFTRRPQFDGNIFASKGRIRVAYDGANLGQSINGSYAIGRDGLSLGGSISYQDFDNVRAADDRVQTPTAFRARGASLFANYRDAAAREWDFSAQYMEQPSTPRFDELVPGFGQDEAASEQFFFAPNTRLFLHGVHRSEGYGRWLDKLEIHAGLQRMRDGRRTQDTGSTRVRRENNRSDLFGLTFQGIAKPQGRHALSYGVDLYFDEVSSSRTQTELTDGSVESIRSRFPDGSTMRNMDIYVHDSIEVTDRAQLDAGFRLSNAEVELTETASAPATKVSNTDASGSVGINYALTDNLDGIGNIARGFRAPNIFDLGTLGARPGNRFNIANPSLGPETVLTGEVGLRYRQSALTVEAVFWGSDYQDRIISVLTGEVDANGRDIVQSQNASSVSLLGAEVSMDWALDDRQNVELSINYTRGETELDSGEIEPSDRIPPLNGRAAWRYQADQWWLSTELAFADRQHRLNPRDVRDPRINPNGTPGWGSLNVASGWTPGERWSITARLENLLDKDYRRHGSGLDAAGQHIKLSIDGQF